MAKQKTVIDGGAITDLSPGVPDASYIENINNEFTGSVPSASLSDNFAQAVENGNALADNGNRYSSIETAINNADSYVFVGPGYFYEQVYVGAGNKDMTIVGSGRYTSLINDAGTYSIHLNETNVTLRNMRIVSRGSASGPAIKCGPQSELRNLTVSSETDGVTLPSNDCTVTNCSVSAESGITSNNATQKHHIANNKIILSSSSNVKGVDYIEDSTITNNIIKANNNSSTLISAYIACTVKGNTLEGGDIGIILNNVENVVVGNQIRGSNTYSIHSVAGPAVVMANTSYGADDTGFYIESNRTILEGNHSYADSDSYTITGSTVTDSRNHST